MVTAIRFTLSKTFAIVTALAVIFALAEPVLAVPPSGHLVISEVATDAAGTNEFIELYNPTGAAIDAANLRLHIRNAAGVDENIALTRTSGRPTTVAANSFYLIAAAGSSYASSADATYPIAGNSLVDNGAAYISTSDTAAAAVVDMVGWGSQPSGGYETGPATNPTASQSLERQPGQSFASRGNGIDTDNNAADFAVRTSAEPQSTSSSSESPAAPGAPNITTAQDVANDHGGSIVVNWTKSSDDGAGQNNVTGYAIWRRLASGTYPASPIGSVGRGVTTFTDSGLVNFAQYIYRVEALDGAYSAYSNESGTVLPIDNLGPTISSLLPTSGSYQASNKVTVSATVSDPSGVTNVGLYLNGTLVANLTPDANGKVSRELSGLREGTHTVTWRANDPTPNIIESSSFFTVDTLSPMATLNLPSTTGTFSVLARISADDQPGGFASGAVDMQLSTDGTFDSEPWEGLMAEKLLTLPAKEGQQTVWLRVRDRAGNLSLVVTAKTMVEVTAVSAPTNALSSTVGNSITLTWHPVSGAIAYVVSYTDGQTLFNPIRTTNTFSVVSNLDLSRTYNFSVAAINPAGSVSAFTPIMPPKPVVAVATATTSASGSSAAAGDNRPTGGPATPPATGTEAPAVTTATEATPAAQATAAPAARIAVNPSPTPSVEPTPSPASSPAEETVKGGSDEQPRDWTRVIVALSILIIAAGVATGGWYLYQWWSLRGEGNGKGKGKSGRW